MTAQHALRKGEHITLLSLSLLRYDVALIFRFSHLNKTVRCCCIIVPLFLLPLIDARSHTHTSSSSTLFLLQGDLYLLWRDTPHLSCSNTQQQSDRLGKREKKKSDSTRHYSEERERDSVVVDDDLPSCINLESKIDFFLSFSSSHSSSSSHSLSLLY